MYGIREAKKYRLGFSLLSGRFDPCVQLRVGFKVNSTTGDATQLMLASPRKSNDTIEQNYHFPNNSLLFGVESVTPHTA
jgi:hypothetical protein